MSTELTLPAGFGPVANVMAGKTGKNDDLSSGVSSSFGIVGYKGKVWSNRFGGKEDILMREDGDGPRGSIEVVFVKAAPAVSKIYYKGGFVDGTNAAPDCWSANGVIPDASVVAKVNPTCADCPMNAWGSRVSDAGKQNKACADSRRAAVVPLGDMDNDLFNGPMLLRIPAASLKDLKAYGDLLDTHGYPYFAVGTRISFDPKEAYPKFVFSAIRPLNEAEAKKVLELREDRRVQVILNETVDTAGATSEGSALPPASPFEPEAGAAAVAPAKVVPTAEEKAAVAAAAVLAIKAKQEARAAEKVTAVVPAAPAPAPVTPAPAVAKSKKQLALEAAAAAAAAAAAMEDDEGEADEAGSAEDDGPAAASFDSVLEGLLGA